MGHMLGSKFPEQEVTSEGAFECMSACVCAYACVSVRDGVCAAGQCVRDKKIRLRDETWCQILALCH